MSSIKEQVVVRVPAQKLYAALTTQEGYNGWWSKDCQIGRKPGDECALKFNKGGSIVSMRFRIDELTANERVKWTCSGHDQESWIGTTLTWSLLADGPRTSLELLHDAWKSEAPEMVVGGWRHFLGSLRAYLEEGKGDPW